MKKLSPLDLRDIIYGCTVLGTGGGGSLAEGLEIIESDLVAGLEFTLASLDEIPDDAWVATPYMCGAVSPADSEGGSDAESQGEALAETSEPIAAWRAMEAHFGKDFFGVVATELGGANTADAFRVAARLGKVIVDGDPAGRSVPELQHTTYFINDLPITPLAFATSFGDVGVLTSVADDFRAEALVRAMAVVSGNKIGVVDHPIQGSTAKGVLIPGSISHALRVGRTRREALETGKDAAEEITKLAGGKLLFRGKVKDFSWETVDGFTVGEVRLAGSGIYSNDEYAIRFKNEHLISYLNSEVDVTVPDLICVLDGEGVPVTNPDYELGMELTVFALPAPEAWLSERGLETFGPKSFGFDIEYRGI